MTMRIAIAHRDPAAARALRRHIDADTRLAFAWDTSTTSGALAGCRRDTPDLLLLELDLPGGLDAAQTTAAIMQASPCAVLVVCQGASAASSRAPYTALAAGAIDAVSEAGFIADPLRCALATKLGQLVRILSISARPAPAVRGSNSLLVIGASTGGPATIATVMRELGDAPLPVPCVIVQHIDPEFAPGMAAWLQTETGHPVTLALGGEPLERGKVYLGGGAGHLALTPGARLGYRREPIDSAYQPSIDEFFYSACAWTSPALAVLLTGMGRDGARGLLALRSKGWTTIAQSPASCAVHSMPQAAMDIGAAQHVLDPFGIGALLRQTLRKGNIA